MPAAIGISGPWCRWRHAATSGDRDHHDLRHVQQRSEADRPRDRVAPRDVPGGRLGLRQHVAIARHSVRPEQGERDQPDDKRSHQPRAERARMTRDQQAERHQERQLRLEDDAGSARGPPRPAWSRRINHHAVATAAATSAPGWPTITPKATGKTPSSSARWAAFASPPPGASRYQVQTSAASSSTVQRTRADRERQHQRTASTSQTSGGGEMKGCGLKPAPRLSIATF